MANVNANIRIDIATAGAVSRLRQLQSQINAFNNSVARGNAAAAASQAAMASSIASMLAQSGRFATSIRDVETATRQLGTAFDKGTLSARQYFRYAASQVPGLTKAFRGLGAEQAAMHRLAEARVKRLNTQYVSLGRNIQGMEKVLAARPLVLPKGMATDLAMAQQKQQLFNRALQLGSTGLVNWGKNTQWAGRQLMVGFTVPLTIAAGAAAKFFMELDKASMQFRRVYGDMNTSTAETERNLKAMMNLGREYTKYGIAVKDVIDVSARAAATGAQNEDLMAATEQTLRLATLGQMEYQRALDATISLQTAFAISSEDLGNKIDFLNAVENQTVLTMEDMALAVPRVAPVIKGLGGDVEDLAVFMTALREGGVSAEQGANALKSGLASLINPTARANETLKGFGINIDAIVKANKGDLMGTVKAFGEALNGLQDFERQQSLEAVFGKYQYARLGALFKNIANDASQSARAMELAGASIEELRAISEEELGVISETVTSQFLGAVEKLKLAVAPIGEMFLKAVTPVINAVTAIADAFANLPDPVKNAIGLIVVAIGAIAPVFLMGLGLVGNAIGNIIKIMLVMRNGIKGVVSALTGQTMSHKYLTEAELESAAAMSTLSGRTTSLTSNLLIQEQAVLSLIGAYSQLARAASTAAASMPAGLAMPIGPRGTRAPTIRMQGFNKGVVGAVPGTGNKDTVPAMLTPGESVITKEATAKYAPILQAMNAGSIKMLAKGEVGGTGRRWSLRDLKALLYGETALRLEDRSSNRARKTTVPTYQQILPMLGLRAGEAAGIPITQKQVAKGKFDPYMKQLEPFAKDFTKRVKKEYDTTFKHIQDKAERLRKAWTTAGAQMTKQILALPPALQDTARRYVGQAPDYYNTMATKKRSPGDTVLSSGRKEVQVGKDAPVKSMSRIGGIATALQSRFFGKTFGPQDIGHVMAPKQTTFQDIADRPGRSAATTVALRNVTGDTNATFPGDQPRRETVRVAQTGATSRRSSVTAKTIQINSSPSGKIYFTSSSGTPTAMGIPSKQAGPSYTRQMEKKAESTRERMRSAGMTEKQIERTMRKYADRIQYSGPTRANMSVQTGGPGGPNDPLENRKQISALKAARQSERSAWRQFGGSLTGLGAVILSGPVTDLARFTKRELRTFTGQMKSAVGGIRKGFGAVVEAARGAGNRLMDAMPSAYRGAPMPADVLTKTKSLGNATLDRSLTGIANGAINASNNLKKFATLVKDVGYAAQGKDIKNATKILANAIGGPNTVANINKSVTAFTDNFKKVTGTVSKFTKDLSAAYSGANRFRDVATMASQITGITKVMASQITGITKVYDKIKTNAGSALTMTKTFTSAVGERLRHIGVMFRSSDRLGEGLAAAARTSGQIIGLNQALGKGKEAITKTIKAIPDASLRAFDKALGGYKQMKQTLATTVTNFGDSFRKLGTSMANGALRSFDSALGGWGALKKSFAGVGTAFKTAGMDGAKAVKASLLAAAKTIGGGRGGGGIAGMFGFGGGGMDDERRQAIMERRNRRMAGGGMALSMASMAPFMMQDQEGKFMGMNANMLGMGMMGAGALMSMVGFISAKFIALAGVAAAAGVALYAYRNSVDEAARKASEFGANLGGAANALNNMATMLGKATPAQRQTQMRLGFTEEEEMAFGEFQSMFETEAGQQFINSLKEATSAERFKLLSQYIQTAVAAGLMDVKVAPAFAKTVAVALEDAFLGASMVRAINEGLAKGSSGLLDLAQKREAAVQQNQAMRNIGAQDEVSYEDSATAVGASIQIIQDFSNAAALAKEEYMAGTISYEQYTAVLNEATEVQARYSGVLSDAISKTSDIGATAQALNKQLGLIVSSEDLKRITDAADIGTDLVTNISSLGDELVQYLPMQRAMTEIRDLLPFTPDEIKKSHEERMRIEQETIGLMAEAIASGMNAATVAAIQQYMKENPESAASQAFQRYAGQGGEFQYKAAAMAEDVAIMGLPGDLENYLTEEQFIDIAIQFEKAGGDAEDFKAFIASIPEEKTVDVMLAFKGMSAEDRIKFINSFMDLSNLLGTENANRIDQLFYQRAAATPTTVPVPGVPGGTTTTTLGEQKTGIEQQLADRKALLARQQYAAGAGTAEGQAAIAKTKAEVDALELQLEQVTGKIYKIKMELDPASQQAIDDALEIKAWDEDTTTLIIEVLLKTEGDLENLPQYAEWASTLEQLPEEVRTILAIDTSSLPDLNQFGPQAEGLVEGTQLIEALPDDVDKQLAFSMMVDENGKVKTPKQLLASTRSLQKDFTNIAKIEDSKLRKEMIFELMQKVTDETGEQITEDAFQQRYQELVDRYGQQVISNLPPDVLFKAIMFDYNADQLRAEAAALRNAAARLANIGGADAQVAKMLKDAAAMEQAASALSGMAGATTANAAAQNYGGSTSPGGGDSGGGGGGETDPLKAMMEDLETQKKLVGNYNKKEKEVTSGFATALRRAGTPEYLIAEIISKGADGIKIAKKLLQDKQKKLKELMKLSLEVVRATFMESQKAAIGNFKTQSAAQKALLGSGIDPSIAIDISADSEQAAMVVAQRKKIADAERKLERARKKGKGIKEAKEDLAKANQQWEKFTNSIKNASKAQEQFNIESAKAQTLVQKKNLAIQGSALSRLMGKGFDLQAAQDFAGDESIAAAVVSAGRAADKAAQKFANLTKRLRETKRGTEEYKKLNKQLAEAEEQAEKTSKKYRSLLSDLRDLTKAQQENLIKNTRAEFIGQTRELGMQQKVLKQLVDSGMSYAQAIEIASDPERALAFAAAAKKGKNVLAAMVAEARALEAATAKFSLNIKLAEFKDAFDKQGFRGAINELVAGNQFGGMISDYLMGLSVSELQQFFNETPEWRQQFIGAFLESIPLAEKIKYLFDQISAQQKYQSTLNRDKANLAKGDIESLEDQLKEQRNLVKIEQDKLKAIQKTIDVIEEENDNLNRGLDLLSRQEEKINEAFDKRLEALDKVEQANARIAQQQQNQLNLAQALSTGDIYAATQAAQQIKQDNATAAIENTREALELSREEQLKNLTIEVNGELLTREQIEKRIEGNNDRIYSIQQDQIKPLQTAIDLIQDQISSIEDAKNAWQDYFDFLEKNSKITIEVDGKSIEFTFSELEDIAKRFNEIMALEEIGGDANKAFDKLIADLAAAGKTLTVDEQKALKQYFGVISTGETTPPTTPEDQDDVTDINAIRDAAIKALPELEKIKKSAKATKKAISETPLAMAEIAKSLVERVQPKIDNAKDSTEKILNKFKSSGRYIVDELIPNSLIPFKDFIAKDLIDQLDRAINKFIRINTEITNAIVSVGNLVSGLEEIQKEIKINITVNTKYTSSEDPKPNKPKKFTGGLIKMAAGGMIPGAIPRDSVPIIASPGEFVVRNAMVNKYGIPMLNDINQGSYQPTFHTPSETTYTKINKPEEIISNPTMYNNNYHISVTAKSNANADEIASATVMKIRQINSMQIRGARG